MPLPSCLSLLLCDLVHADPATGKKYVLGTFSTWRARQFPAVARLTVFWSITDFAGDVELAFRLVDDRFGFDDAAAPLFMLPAKVRAESPLEVLEGMFVVRVTLPAAGVYHCELLAGRDGVNVATADRCRVALMPAVAIVQAVPANRVMQTSLQR